ncbi:UmuC protein [Streptomyces sp. NBRC 110611]|nr:UmuC protein [Streptomyces sp. NBRC 110611]
MVDAVERAEEGGHGLGVRHIHGPPTGSASQAFRRGLQCGGRTAAEYDPGTGCGRLMGDPEPDARAAADQDDDPPAQSTSVQPTSVRPNSVRLTSVRFTSVQSVSVRFTFLQFISLQVSSTRFGSRGRVRHQRSSALLFTYGNVLTTITLITKSQHLLPPEHSGAVAS